MFRPHSIRIERNYGVGCFVLFPFASENVIRGFSIQVWYFIQALVANVQITKKL